MCFRAARNSAAAEYASRFCLIVPPKVEVQGISARRLAKFAAVEPRLDKLATALGVPLLATLVNARQDDLSRIIAGLKPVPPEIAKRVVDLDYLLARALQIFGDAQVVIDWLDGIEPAFGYAKPIVMLAKKGAAPLLDVLDIIEAGAYS